MAAGDILILHENGGGETISTSIASAPHDTQDRVDGIYNVTGLGSTVTVSEAGHYLYAYSTAFQNTTTNARSECQGSLRVNTTEVQGYGRSSGFSRGGSSLDEMWLSAATILDLGVSDSVNMRLTRTDTSGGTMTRLAASTTPASGTGLFMLKLDDDWSYCRLTRSTNEGVSSTSATSIEWDTQDELDTADFAHDTGTNPASITFKTTGHYLVTCSCVIEASTTGRYNPVLILTLGGVSSRLRTTRYSRTDLAGCTTVALSFAGVVTTSSTNVVAQVSYAHINGAPADGIPQGGSMAIAIAKLPDSTSCIHLAETTGGQATNVDAVVTWDTQTEINTDDFTHSTSTNSERAFVDTDDDYLWFTNQYTTRGGSPTGTNRISHRWRWRLNGADATHGDCGAQNRGDTNCLQAGASGVYLASAMTAGDYVEVEYTQESTNTDSLLTHVGAFMGLQGVRLGSLFVTDLVEVLSETVNVDDADPLPLRGILRTLDETVNVDDADPNDVRGLMRILSETVRILDDDPVYVRGRIRVLSEQVEVSEQLLRLRSLVRHVDETVDVLDTEQVVRALIRHLDETVNIQDAIQSVPGRVRVLGTETVHVLDAAVLAVLLRLRATRRLETATGGFVVGETAGGGVVASEVATGGFVEGQSKGHGG